VIAALLAACALAGEVPGDLPGEAPGEAPPDRALPDVVVVSLTAQRRDRIGAYGHGGGLSPALDALAAEGARFDQATAPAHWTLPAQASLLSGLFPEGHGVLSRDRALPAAVTTLPEILTLYGYRTGAFTAGLDTDSGFGLDQGFQVYDDDTAGATTRPLSDTLEAALAWLDAGEAPALLWLQSYEAHDPYCRGLPPAPAGAPLAGHELRRELLVGLDAGALGAADRAAIAACYDEGVRRNDAGLAALVAALEARGTLDSTLLVVLAEHGELLGEGGSYDRFGSGELREAVVHVPLVVRGPGVTAGGVGAAVSLVDLAPTVLELLEIPVHWEMQGRSLAGALSGAPLPETPAFAVTGDGRWAARDGRWKLAVGPEGRALYDLSSDPGEQRDLAAAHPEEVLRLSRAYAEWHRRVTASPPGAAPIEIDPALKKALEDAGYW
jgi:arylsulfatase A-like enzyme